MMIRVDKLTDIERQLYKKLVEIWDDVEFHIGILAHLKNDEERQQVLDFIQSKMDITSDDVFYYVLTMEKSQKNQLS